ncbi:MAG: RimJ/RimL family protein N-acetyltransferase [Phenylobacterium sp.]|jgi:RimJ/RimL family protein N-acetyltransferase
MSQPFNPQALNPQALALSSDKILLTPLTREHAEAFHQAAKDNVVWTWTIASNPCKTLQGTQQWIETALAEHEAGRQLPFVIIDKASGKLVGSTRYLSINHANFGIEIGHTFISPAFQRTYVNSHAKYCLLNHAFEQLGAIRVELKTHERNEKSRNAIARIGASFEGIARNNRILPDGTIRNTAIFAMTREDWPQAKQQLLTYIDRN